MKTPKGKLNDSNDVKCSKNGTPLRQMSITESFKYTKPKVLKMNTQFNVSSVCIVIDSDSESSSESLQIKKEDERNDLVNIEKDMDQAKDLITSDLPSPPKKAKLMIGVNKPSDSTSLVLSTDPVFDEDTMPFPANSAEPVSDRSEEERLIINDPCDGENAVSDLNFQNYFSSRPGLVTSETNNDDHPRNNMTATKKNYSLETYNSNNNGITAEKIRVQEKNNNERTSVTETKSKTKKKSLEGTELENVNDFANGETKDTPNKNAITTKLRDATPSMPTITPAEIHTKKQNKKRGENARKRKINKADIETREKRKDKIDDETKERRKDKLDNETTEKRKHKTDNETKEKRRDKTGDETKENRKDTLPDQSIIISSCWTIATPSSKSSTPIQKKPAQNDQSRENTKEKLVLTLRKAHCDKMNFKNPDDPLHRLLEKNKGPVNTFSIHSKEHLKKNVIDEQQPCCSKSLNKGGSPAEKVNQDKAANQTTNSATPEKQNSSTDFSGNKGSPRKNVFKSPDKGSPIKSRSIKSLKSKEGKQLHTRQLDELVKLFKMVINTRHLKSFLDESEQKKITTFLSMEENIQYALMKLFVWQRQFYSIYAFCTKAQIEFNDDKDVLDMFEYLREEQFIDTAYRQLASLSELLDKLHDVRIRDIMDELKIKPTKTKRENVAKLLSLAETQSTLTRTKSFKDLILDKVEKKMGMAFRLRSQVYDTFYNVFLLGTFANPALDDVQVFFKTLIYDKAVFPETSVEDYRVFYSKNQFRQYGLALKLYKELDGYLTSRASEEKKLGIYKSGLEAYRQLQDLITENVEEPTSPENNEIPHLKRFTAQHVYCKILSACCKSLYTKQNGNPQEVKKWLEYLIANFPNSKRSGQWYHTLIQLHMRHLDKINYEKAAKLLIEALHTKKDVLGDVSKYELGALGKSLKISRKHKIDQLYHDRVAKLIPKPIDPDDFPIERIDAQCIRSEIPGRKLKYIDKSGDEMVVRGVEQVALGYYADTPGHLDTSSVVFKRVSKSLSWYRNREHPYASETTLNYFSQLKGFPGYTSMEIKGYPGGEHCEGQLVKALLMLCFCDIIYNPREVVPATFISPLQIAPLDMFTTNFYKNRQDPINERLEEIRSGWSEKDLIEFAVKNWRDHAHERAAFGTIMNVIPDEAMVEVLIVVMGRRVLAAIFERLIKNISEFGKGMPDLLIWNPEKKYCKFVEVKGEGDKLSNAQKLWLQYLKLIGASIEICLVHSMGSKRKKIKKVLTENNEDHDEDSDEDVSNER